MSDIERELGLDQQKLTHLALLLGSDYTEGIAGIGVVNAMEVVHSFPGLKGLQAFKTWVENPEELLLAAARGGKWGGGRGRGRGGGRGVGRGGKKRGRGDEDEQEEWEGEEEGEQNESQEGFEGSLMEQFKQSHRGARRQWQVPASFPSVAVVEAYTRPNVDRATERFVWGRLHQEQLREYCRSKFGWDVAKVDETLQPVVQAQATGQTQLRMEQFLSFNQRFAKIKSKRLQQAVARITGVEQSGLNWVPGGNGEEGVEGGDDDYDEGTTGGGGGRGGGPTAAAAVAEEKAGEFEEGGLIGGMGAGGGNQRLGEAGGQRSGIPAGFRIADVLSRMEVQQGRAPAAAAASSGGQKRRRGRERAAGGGSASAATAAALDDGAGGAQGGAAAAAGGVAAAAAVASAAGAKANAAGAGAAAGAAAAVAVEVQEDLKQLEQLAAAGVVNGVGGRKGSLKGHTQGRLRRGKESNGDESGRSGSRSSRGASGGQGRESGAGDGRRTKGKKAGRSRVRSLDKQIAGGVPGLVIEDDGV